MEKIKATRYYSRETFSKKLDTLLARDGISQAEFFRRIGAVQGNFSKWKKGDAKPSVENLLAIAINFKVSLDWLLGLEKNFLLQEPPEVPYKAKPAVSTETRREIKTRLRLYLSKNNEALPPEHEAELEFLLEEFYLEYLEIPDDRIIKALLPACRVPLKK